MSDSALDPAIFGDIRDLMGDALGEFITTYLHNSPRLINQIETGLLQNDTETVYQCAHQLKGGSGSIGALRLAAISLAIETAGKAGNTDGLAALLEQLKTEFALIEAELKPLL